MPLDYMRIGTWMLRSKAHITGEINGSIQYHKVPDYLCMKLVPQCMRASPPTLEEQDFQRCRRESNTSPTSSLLHHQLLHRALWSLAQMDVARQLEALSQINIDLGADVISHSTLVQRFS